MKKTLAAATAALAFALFGCAASGANPEQVAASSEQETTTPAPSLDGTPFAPLEAGTHSAPSFWPPLTFTVPDGWFTERAAKGLLPLVPDTAENRTRSIEGGYPVTFLYVLPNIAAAAEDCTDAAAQEVGLTAGEIVGALATRAGLNTDGPDAVTIGGLSGQQVDLSIAPDSTATCPEGGGPFVPLVHSPGFISWGAEPGERWRIIDLDVPGLPSGMSATVMIVIYSADPEVWDDHLSAATEVVESFEFDTTPPGP